MAYENIIYEVDQGIATITFNRPKALNALNGALLSELSDALDQVAADEPRATGRTAEIARGARGGFHQQRVAGQVEVVAAREEQHLAPVHEHARPLRAVQHAHAPVRAAGVQRVQRSAGDLAHTHRR